MGGSRKILPNEGTTRCLGVELRGEKGRGDVPGVSKGAREERRGINEDNRPGVS